MRRKPATTLTEDQSSLLAARYPQWALLTLAERERAEHLITVFRRHTNFEILPGVKPTDDLEVTIAAAGALLILALPIDRIPHLSSVIVHPRSVNRRVVRNLGGLMVSESRSVLSGQAHHYGPVLISWRHALYEMNHPEIGRQVIIHELAHKLDMANAYDGTPPISADKRAEFIVARDNELARMRTGRDDGILDRYGATDVGEFFAVATERFFTDPIPMAEGLPDLYAAMADAFGQDTVGRLYQSPTRSGNG
ncbi:MAG: hypothetical protein GEU79_02665 [Acidimicrobiia bacterium]|nr:hypothetical protein [Acidimicrobiia bacterium]